MEFIAKIQNPKSKILILSSLFAFSLIYQGILLSSYPPTTGPDGADFLRLGNYLKTSGRREDA